MKVSDPWLGEKEKHIIYYWEVVLCALDLEIYKSYIYLLTLGLDGP